MKHPTFAAVREAGRTSETIMMDTRDTINMESADLRRLDGCARKPSMSREIDRFENSLFESGDTSCIPLESYRESSEVLCLRRLEELASP